MAGVKLKDIAEKTGVSISTVSRILSGDSNRKMKEETITSVIEAARELGWYENRKEKLRHSMPVIKLTAVIIGEDLGGDMSPFCRDIVDGMKREISEKCSGMRLSFNVIVAADDILDILKEDPSDAVILIGRVQTDLLEKIAASVPYALYAGVSSVSGMDQIVCDAREGVRDAVRYLHGKGHRNIGYIGPTAIQNEIRNEFRYLGYIEGLSEMGLSYDPILVEDTYLSVPDGYSGAERLFSRVMPSAIICANDSVAIGVLRFLREKDIKCPEEVMVTGFDNIDVSSFIKPSLSTFDVPRTDLGRFSVRIAVDRIEHHREHAVKVSLPYVIVERESTKGFRK